MQQVHVEGVYPNPSDKKPVLVLMTRDHSRALLIGSGPFETMAILTELQGVTMPRPKTHDLFAAVIEAMDGTLTHVAVTGAEDNVFLATITLTLGGTDTHDLDARPSDAIALAVRLDVPIYVEDDILARYGMSVEALSAWMRGEEPGGSSIEEQAEEFRKFLDDVDPDDFSDDPPED